jgi:hypothetical protein
MRHMEIRGVGRYLKTLRRHLPFTEPKVADWDVEYNVQDCSPSRDGRYAITRTRIAFSAAAKERLREHLGDKTTLITEEDQSRDFEELHEENNGVPYLDEERVFDLGRSSSDISIL